MGEKLEKEWREIRGRRLRALRKRKGLTQVELGKLIGVGSPSPTISFMERGLQGMSADQVERIAQILGVTSLYLTSSNFDDEDLELVDLFLKGIKNPLVRNTIKMVLEANQDCK